MGDKARRATNEPDGHRSTVLPFCHRMARFCWLRHYVRRTCTVIPATPFLGLSDARDRASRAPGDNSHQLIDLSPALAVHIIEAHIVAKQRELVEACARANLELDGKVPAVAKES